MSDAVAPVTAPAAPVAATPVAPGAEATPATPAAAAAEQAAARIELAKMPPHTIVTMVVDGQEVEMTAADAFKKLGRAASANKRFEEAAKTRAETDSIVQRLADAVGDPRRFRSELRELGLNPKQYAQILLAAEEEDEALTPEQRRIRELEARESQRENEEKTREEQAYQAQVQGIRQQYRDGFAQAMDAANVPAHNRARMERVLFAECAQIREVEGREIRKSDVRTILEEMGYGVKPTAAPVIAPKIVAAPQLPPRDESGKFQPTNGDPKHRVDGQGRRVVQDLSKIWG